MQAALPSPQPAGPSARALQPRQLVFSSQNVDARARPEEAPQARARDAQPAAGARALSAQAVEDIAGRVTEDEFAKFVESF